jgi:hypothetical protein
MTKSSFAILILAFVALAAPMLAAPSAAEAAPYWPWCSRYATRASVESCAFATYDQCMETVRGIGGFCYTNPYPPPPPATRWERPRRHVVGSTAGEARSHHDEVRQTAATVSREPNATVFREPVSLPGLSP